MQPSCIRPSSRQFLVIIFFILIIIICSKQNVLDKCYIHPFHMFLLNRFRTEQGHCGACRRKWRLTDTDLCPCGETQTMSLIVESCSLTKLNGGLSRLHSADEDAVSWLTSYGS